MHIDEIENEERAVHITQTEIGRAIMHTNNIEEIPRVPDTDYVVWSEARMALDVDKNPDELLQVTRREEDGGIQAYRNEGRGPFVVLARDDWASISARGLKPFLFAVYIGQRHTGQTVRVIAHTEEEARGKISLLKLTMG